jgi:glucosyl-dolichyl phosphate glucuronosyltransferase
MKAGSSASSRPVPTPEPAGSEVPQLTVAICTRNRARFLETAVQSVLRQMTADAELLIVDNASTDATAEIGGRLAAGTARVVFCREDTLGLSAARNTALARARGEFVIFLDDDALAEPGWLVAYRHFVSAPPSAAIAVVGGGVVPEYEVPPPWWYSPQATTLNLGNLPRRISARGGLWGCNIAYRREAALRAGGFDCGLGRKGDFLGLHEEGDLNRRVEMAGGQIWWLPSARIRHFVPAARLTLKWQFRSGFCGGRSSATMRLRTMPRGRERWLWGLGRLLIAPVHVGYNLGQALLASCVGQGRWAVRKVTHAVRTAGFCWQLLRELTAAGERSMNRPVAPREASA